MRLSIFVPNRPVHCNAIRDLAQQRGFVIQTECSNHLIRELVITLEYEDQHLAYYVKGAADALIRLFVASSSFTEADIETAVNTVGSRAGESNRV